VSGIIFGDLGVNDELHNQSPFPIDYVYIT
jgi:hypothetical protein